MRNHLACGGIGKIGMHGRKRDRQRRRIPSKIIAQLLYDAKFWSSFHGNLCNVHKEHYTYFVVGLSWRTFPNSCDSSHVCSTEEHRERTKYEIECFARKHAEVNFRDCRCSTSHQSILKMIPVPLPKQAGHLSEFFWEWASPPKVASIRTLKKWVKAQGGWVVFSPAVRKALVHGCCGGLSQCGKAPCAGCMRAVFCRPSTDLKVLNELAILGSHGVCNSIQRCSFQTVINCCSFLQRSIATTINCHQFRTE